LNLSRQERLRALLAFFVFAHFRPRKSLNPGAINFWERPFEGGGPMNAGSTESPDWSKIPAPADDGAARHLQGMRVPRVSLPATDGSSVDLSALAGLVVVYAYPRTGRPGIENPDGWDLIPGARGCTPQSCAFRKLFAELKALGVHRLFGLSTQSTAYQREAAERLQLPFSILSDEHRGCRPSRPAV
jgi:peroxiredoxin